VATRVLISDSLSDKGVQILKQAGLDVALKPKLTPEALLSEIGEYEGLVIRSGTKVTAQVIESAKRLKVIGRAGSGLDNVDIPAATKRGIVVMNTPGGNTLTTAEHTLSLMLALSRMIPQATASMKAGKWEKSKFMGIELYNKTLGIVGFGQIGTYLARLAQGLNMNVLAYDPFLSTETAMKSGVEVVDLQDLYRRSDFITVHTPLTPETKHLINADAIKQMKDGVRIINAARGGIIKESDLVDALKSGKVAGAALDVFEEEPVGPNHLLVGLPNVIATPHIGAATNEAQENVALAVAEQIADFLVRGVIRHAVNIPSVSADQLPALRPYLALAEKLGSFEAQRYEGAMERVTVEYRGEAGTLATAPLTVAVLKGVMSPILESVVNYVNAPVIAQERGIEVNEVKSTDSGSFQSLVVVRIDGNAGSRRIAGTIFHRQEPRIVQIDGSAMEVIPEGCMLMMTNNDKPGVIGAIGNLLGTAGINISRMQLGREAEGGKAISVVSIDSPASPDVLDALRKLPNILTVKQINL
jgi:D-3-phosphoglycerate dehydrogenase / 2-oxoglutarate reductase